MVHPFYLAFKIIQVSKYRKNKKMYPHKMKKANTEQGHSVFSLFNSIHLALFGLVPISRYYYYNFKKLFLKSYNFKKLFFPKNVMSKGW